MMETEFRLTVNGAERRVTCEPETPLLDVLRHDLGLAGPKFGCGVGLCGACFVLIEGRARASCDLPVSAVGGLDQSIRIEMFGDLHEYGALGRVVTKSEALAAV